MGPSFLDPLKTSNGQDYGPYRYKQIIKELYIIAKNLHTSYTDLLDITPTEKHELLNLIIDENERSKEQMDKIKKEAKSKKGKR